MGGQKLEEKFRRVGFLTWALGRIAGVGQHALHHFREERWSIILGRDLLGGRGFGKISAAEKTQMLTYAGFKGHSDIGGRV